MDVKQGGIGDSRRGDFALDGQSGTAHAARSPEQGVSINAGHGGEIATRDRRAGHVWDSYKRHFGGKYDGYGAVVGLTHRYSGFWYGDSVKLMDSRGSGEISMIPVVVSVRWRRWRGQNGGKLARRGKTGETGRTDTKEGGNTKQTGESLRKRAVVTGTRPKKAGVG